MYEGFHFHPTGTGKKLINDYLKRQLRGEPTGDFTVMKDVYAKEPWLFDHTNHPFSRKMSGIILPQKLRIPRRQCLCYY